MPAFNGLPKAGTEAGRVWRLMLGAAVSKLMAARETAPRSLFFDDFTSTDTIDMANAKTAGFNWYREQWWGDGTTHLDSIGQSGTVLRLGGGTGRGRLQSAIAAPNPQNYIGNVWGGQAYFEVRMRFDPTDVDIEDYFGIYLFSIEHIYDNAAEGDARWPGQPAGYGHFCELDVFELARARPDHSYRGRNTYQGTHHDWSGTYDPGRGWQRNIYNRAALQPAGVADWAQFHTYGALWIPQNGSTPGSIQWFFDDRPLGSVYWLGPPGSPPLPGEGAPYTATSVTQDSPAKADRTFAITDRHRLAMQLDGNAKLPMYVDWVRVRQ